MYVQKLTYLERTQAYIIAVTVIGKYAPTNAISSLQDENIDTLGEKYRGCMKSRDTSTNYNCPSFIIAGRCIFFIIHGIVLVIGTTLQCQISGNTEVTVSS
jgi:hypothetical protein